MSEYFNRVRPPHGWLVPPSQLGNLLSDSFIELGWLMIRGWKGWRSRASPQSSAMSITYKCTRPNLTWPGWLVNVNLLLAKFVVFLCLFGHVLELSTGVNENLMWLEIPFIKISFFFLFKKSFEIMPISMR